MKQELLEQFARETGVHKPVDIDLDYYQSQYVSWLEERAVKNNSSLPCISSSFLLDEDNDIDVVGNCPNCGVEFHIHK